MWTQGHGDMEMQRHGGIGMGTWGQEDMGTQGYVNTAQEKQGHGNDGGVMGMGAEGHGNVDMGTYRYGDTATWERRDVRTCGHGVGDVGT